ncbi:hypothetical protein ACRAWF_40095 [Streptomyces sp. L7]
MPKTWFYHRSLEGVRPGVGGSRARTRRPGRLLTSRSESAVRRPGREVRRRGAALRLDVADRAAAFEAAQEAVDEFGGLDVVINSTRATACSA